MSSSPNKNNSPKIIIRFLPKVSLFYAILLLISIILTRISGPFPNYPPIDKNPIPWDEVWLELPRLIITTLFVSMIFYMGLYWDWYAKNKKSEEEE